MPFTRKQHIYLLERYLATKSYADTIAAFTTEYKDAQFPNKSSISRLVKKFCDGECDECTKEPNAHCVDTRKSRGNWCHLLRHPHSSIHKVARRMGTSIKSTHYATRLLKLHPYHVSVLYEVNSADCPKYIEFCKCLLHLSHDNITVFDKFFLAMKRGGKWTGM